MACAAALAGRITRAGVVCGLGRLDIPGNTARMNPFARLSFALARRAPGVSRLLNGALAPLLRNSPRRTLRLLAAKLRAPICRCYPARIRLFAAAFRQDCARAGAARARSGAVRGPWEPRWILFAFRSFWCS